MNNFGRNIALWVIIVLLLLALVNLFNQDRSDGPSSDQAYSEFLADVEAGQVNEVTIQGNAISGKYMNGKSFSTYAPDDPDLIKKLRERGVRINAAAPEDGSTASDGPRPEAFGDRRIDPLAPHSS